MQSPTLYLKLIGYIFRLIWEELSRTARTWTTHRRDRWLGRAAPQSRDRNIVVVGASFAGHRVAELLTKCLPPNSPYRVVVVEPNSHFQFTWVLPRFCTVEGQEHKAFIPYGGIVRNKPEGVLRWIQDRVLTITDTYVTLQNSHETIPFEILVLATGSSVRQGLPSRVNATEKTEGMALMRSVQKTIKAAETVVVVGGGAAGVEIATDAKDLYPSKRVILVHSRESVMHRFGQGLQLSAMEALESLGVEVMLKERVRNLSSEERVFLQSGREIECDLVVSSPGRKRRRRNSEKGL